MQVQAQTQGGVRPFGSETLEALRHRETVSKGEVLFRQGDQPRGVYFLESGEVDLMFAAKTGQAKPLRTAEPGQILGLSCVVSHKPHDCTATARTPCNVGFVDSSSFQHLLDEQPALWFKVLEYISLEVNACWDCMRSLSR